MFLEKYKKIIHDSFLIGVILKGINAVLEIIGGIAIFFVSKSGINWFIKMITVNELTEDPHDLLANYLLKIAHDFSLNILIFSSIYLLSHGIVKLVLVWALLKRKIWAYPTAIAVFVGFIIYQVYRYSHTGSFTLILLSLLDFIIIILTYIEYRLLKLKLVLPTKQEL